MAACRGSSSRWFFTREQLETTPSRRSGVEPDKELSYRQQAANLIQDMGQRLNVYPCLQIKCVGAVEERVACCCYGWIDIISPTTLFLAAKVEEQPRKLEHVIKVAHACLNPQEPQLDTKSNYKPTVIACVCIHLACKWSNWEIPVSTDAKHWWEYVDPSVTLELLDELTHEFLQILEKTPSRLKRIRNWRANQAAKKPKGDGQLADNSFPGPSMVQNPSLVDSITVVSANASFLKSSSSASFPVTLPSNSAGATMQGGHSLDSTAAVTTSLQNTSYNFTAPNDWPQHQDQSRSDVYSLKQEALNLQQGASGQLHAATLHHRPEKNTEFSSSKHEHKSSSSSKHALLAPPPIPPPQKMTLDKYREKHAAEKRKLEGLGDTDIQNQYAPTTQLMVENQPHHRKHAQQLQVPGGSAVASPIKMKIPLSNSEKTEKRDKSGSLKLRIPIPPTEKPLSKEELKMKIKVSSSERHSSSDEGSGKSKHSSLHIKEYKEKHRDHSSHRHHGGSHKHSHLHSHMHSGNSSGSKLHADGTVTAALRSPVVLSSEGGPSSSSSSRKRTHPDISHNHHSKMSKSSGSSSNSSSVKQYVSSHNSVLNLPFPPPKKP
ncbi:UNVERIFIED_CONTAM: hypothetical protein FKN15_021177 [Acipenser sinensis]